MDDVPLLEPFETEDTGDGYITSWYTRDQLIAYGDAREAAAKEKHERST